jgi:octaprenyl-diphosphate synthase
MLLTEIEHLVAPLNSNFLSAYQKLTDSPIALIKQINSHVQNNQGKQLRPLLTMLSAACCGFPIDADANHPLFAVTAAIETLHSSTLIHDDVVDNSDTRRGKPSINSIWDNKIAVLAGDFYLAKVMQTLNRVDNSEITAIINDAVIQMSEGELLQLSLSGKYNTDIETYITIISKKTASFMAACCQTGATFATLEHPRPRGQNELEHQLRQQARLFGLNIGIAFQIRDDILDYMPTSVTGKPQGNDLVEGKCTLPLIFALRNKVPLTDTNINNIIQAVTDGGYLNQAATVLEQYLSKAREALTHLPDNQYRSAMSQIVDKLRIGTPASPRA